MRKILWLCLLSLVVIAGCKGGGYGNQVTGTAAAGPIKEFDAVINGFSYSPPSITVHVGDIVRINIRNRDTVTHGISLPVFGVQEFVRPGQTKTIQFVANQQGSGETFCSTDHGEKLLIKVI